MNEQKTLDYARIAQAIGYIRENFKRQPGLDEIAGEVALSTAHFQRMFTEWVGISPKKFLQYTSIEYAKRILNETHASLFDAAQETGLSGTGRLYDLFVNIEGMTPGEYKNGGESLSINYSFAKSPFGEIFIKVFVVWSLQTNMTRLLTLYGRSFLMQSLPRLWMKCSKMLYLSSRRTGVNSKK